MLLALFTAIALAFVLARRLSAPLSILAEGTQAVAAGDYTPKQAVYSRDELGILTRSFKQMTSQLDEARRDNERHRGELEAARAYLESILANLSAGVLVFDRRFVLRTVNEGALAILADDFAGLLGEETDGVGCLAEQSESLRAGDGLDRCQHCEVVRDDSEVGGGWVVAQVEPPGWVGVLTIAHAQSSRSGDPSPGC